MWYICIWGVHVCVHACVCLWDVYACVRACVRAYMCVFSVSVHGSMCVSICVNACVCCVWCACVCVMCACCVCVWCVCVVCVNNYVCLWTVVCIGYSIAASATRDMQS